MFVIGLKFGVREVSIVYDDFSYYCDCAFLGDFEGLLWACLLSMVRSWSHCAKFDGGGSW